MEQAKSKEFQEDLVRLNLELEKYGIDATQQLTSLKLKEKE